MGYILLAGFILIVTALFVVGIAIGPKRPKGRLPSDHPVEVAQPAADEPTPGQSIVASEAQIRHAQQHTPSA